MWSFLGSISLKVWGVFAAILTVVALLLRFKHAGRVQERYESTQAILKSVKENNDIRKVVNSLPEPAVYDSLQRWSRR